MSEVPLREPTAPPGKSKAAGKWSGVTRYMKATEDERGEWVLVDHLNRDQPGLLSIGSDNYHGASLRKNLSPMGRELLVDRIRVVAETATEMDDVVTRRGEDFRILVRPVLAPTSGMLVAVQGIYYPLGAPVAERPLVGALEWVISAAGRIDTAWNDDLFGIYEIDRTGASPTGDMNQWVSQLIAPEDRARMKITIDAAIKSGNAQRYLVPYRIVTRFGTANPGVRNLEVSGRVIPDQAKGIKLLRAITREVNEVTPNPITPGFGDYQSSSLLRAVFDLADDRVFAAVDTSCWQMFMTSKSWEDHNLQAPRFGYLPHIVYPGEFRTVTEVLESTDPAFSAVVNLLHRDGSYLPYRISGSGGSDKATDGVPEYAMLRMIAQPVA